MIDLAGNVLGREANREAKGATFDGTYLWVIGISGSGTGDLFQVRMYQVNPLHLLQEYSLGSGTAYQGIAWDGHGFWVTLDGSAGASKLRRYAGHDFNAPAEEFDLGFQPRDLCYKDGYLWIVDFGNDQIKKVDPTTVAVLEAWNIPLSGEIQAGGLVWGRWNTQEVMWLGEFSSQRIHTLRIGQP